MFGLFNPKKPPMLARVLTIVRDPICGDMIGSKFQFADEEQKNRTISLLKYFDECSALGRKPKHSEWNKAYGGDPDDVA